MSENNIAVIGAGNGGCAMAADLALAGWKVNLYELPRFKQNIEAISSAGGINITGAARTGFAKIAVATDDIVEAIENVSSIMITTVALAHEEVAKILCSHVKENQAIFMFPGNAGSFIFAKLLKKTNKSINIPLVEVLTLPYGCRKTGPTSVNVSRLLGRIPLAALPAKENKRVIEVFSRFYPNCFLMTDVLEVAISNPNLIVHPGPAMLNMARIEFSNGDFGLYQEGFSPSVMKVMDGLDKDLMAVQKAIDLPVRSFKKLFEIRYEKPFDEQFEFMRKAGNRGPTNSKTRYITEDVPVGMVLISSIGRWLNVQTPTIDAVIHFCGLMNETDYRKEGRSLDNLGLSKLTLKGLKNYLQTGEM